MKPPRKPHVDLLFGGALVWSGLGTIAYAVGIVGGQCLAWLREAVWHPVPIRDVVSPPVTGLAGLNVILNWIADLHASIPLLVVGVIAIACGLGIRETALGSHGDAERRFQDTIDRIKGKP